MCQPTLNEVSSSQNELPQAVASTNAPSRITLVLTRISEPDVEDPVYYLHSHDRLISTSILNLLFNEEEDHHLSNKQRNKLAHALNGNTSITNVENAINAAETEATSWPIPDLSNFRPHSKSDDLIIDTIINGLKRGGIFHPDKDQFDRRLEQLEPFGDHNGNDLINYENRIYDEYLNDTAVPNLGHRNADVLVPGNWYPSSRSRNKLQHSLNGNINGKKNAPKTKRAKQPRKKKTQQTAVRRSRPSNASRAVAPTAQETYTARAKPVVISGHEMCTSITTVAQTFGPSFAPVSGTTAFNQYINPGNSDMFPGLSIEAARYEKFRIRKLRFEFVTNSTTANGGVVAMAIDYDSLDTNGASPLVYTLRDLALLQGACSETVWDPKRLTLTYTPRVDDKKWFYVTERGQTTTYPFHDLYPGILVGGAYSTAAFPQQLGQLWCRYEVELMNRKRPISTAETFVQWAVAAIPTGTAATFATPTLATGNSSEVSIATNNQLYFTKSGRYAIHVRQVGTVITASPVIDVANAVNGSITAVTLVDGTTSHIGITTGALTSHLYAVYDVVTPANSPAVVRIQLGDRKSVV